MRADMESAPTSFGCDDGARRSRARAERARFVCQGAELGEINDEGKRRGVGEGGAREYATI